MVEDNASIIMKCKRCNQNVPLMEMKYDKDGKTLICRSCRGLSMQEHLDKLKTERKEKERKAETAQVMAKAAAGAMRYRCTACGYSFSRASIKPTKCPYCSKTEIIPMKSITSDSLLKDI